MSLTSVVIIALLILFAGGFSRRFGDYGYGRGSGLTGLLGVILLVVIVLALMRKL